jgi:transposase
MSRFMGSAQTAIDYNTTIIGALELSSKKWVLAVQLPGVDRHSRYVLDACSDGVVSFVARLKARCAAAGREITRVILTHEAGRDGFWVARFLARHNIEVHVMQPSSLPVDRRARRAKTDIIDVEMLLRTLMGSVANFCPTTGCWILARRGSIPHVVVTRNFATEPLRLQLRQRRERQSEEHQLAAVGLKR